MHWQEGQGLGKNRVNVALRVLEIGLHDVFDAIVVRHVHLVDAVPVVEDFHFFNRGRCLQALAIYGRHCPSQCTNGTHSHLCNCPNTHFALQRRVKTYLLSINFKNLVPNTQFGLH